MLGRRNPSFRVEQLTQEQNCANVFKTLRSLRLCLFWISRARIYGLCGPADRGVTVIWSLFKKNISCAWKRISWAITFAIEKTHTHLLYMFPLQAALQPTPSSSSMFCSDLAVFPTDWLRLFFIPIFQWYLIFFLSYLLTDLINVCALPVPSHRHLQPLTLHTLRLLLPLLCLFLYLSVLFSYWPHV